MEVFHRQVKLARYGLIDIHVYGYADGRYVAQPSSRHPLPVTQAPLPDEPQARSADAAVELLRRALDRAWFGAGDAVFASMPLPGAAQEIRRPLVEGGVLCHRAPRSAGPRCAEEVRMHPGPVAPHPSSLPHGSAPARWVVPAVVLVATLFAAGAVIALVRPALLVAPGADVGAATHVYAGYLASRDSALAVALVVLLLLEARQMLAGALLLTAFVQVADVVVDAATGRLVLVPGLVVLAALIVATATRAAHRPLWQAASSRDVS